MVKSRFILLSALLPFVCSCSIQKVLTSEKSEYMSSEEMEQRYSPEGHLESIICKSSAGTGPSERRMLVYLPEDYYSTEKRYPALYIFHGARGNETSWIKDGNILHSSDSLVCSGKMPASIIVMTNMNEYDDDQDAFQSRFKKPIESFFETNGVVESFFVKDVVELVDSLYRTIPDKGHRAIAGLSVGAMQSIYISATYPDVFGYVGLFSPMFKAPIRHSMYSDFYKDLKHKQIEQFSQAPSIYMIGIGRSDFFYLHMKHYRRYLDNCNYPYQYVETGGGHNWTNWKVFYVEFAQKIFK